MFSKKSLTASEWKHIQLPSLDWRSKIFINSLKELLLKDKHDPFQPQEDEFLSALSQLDISKDKILDGRTYKKWWSGDSCPTTAKIEFLKFALEEIGNEHVRLAELLDQGTISTPLLRNLRSIDGRNLELDKKKNENTTKEKIADDCLSSISKVWSVFTNPFYEHLGNLDYRNQVKNLTLREPNILSDPRLLETNYNATSLPYSVSHSHTLSDPHTLLSFLINVGAYLSPLTEEELNIWALDLASTVAACLTKQFTSSKLITSIYFGEELQVQIGWTARMFWDNYQDPIVSMKGLSLTVKNSDYRDEFLKTLIKARNMYFNTFHNYGISNKDVMNKLFLFTDLGTPFIPFGLTRDGKIIMQRPS